jgi:hypothetical protein
MTLNLPTGWFSPELPGHPCDDVLCLVSLESLPPLPAETALDGSLSWLADPGRDLEWAVGRSELSRVFDVSTLDRLRSTVAELGLQLPDGFERFMGTERRNWVRSVNASWLQLPERIVSVPGTEVLAIRFMNDQQGALHWYLTLDHEGEHGVIVSIDRFDDPDPLDPPGLIPERYWCAPSFEAFLYRYWLECEIYFRLWKQELMTPEQQTYADHLTRG